MLTFLGDAIIRNLRVFSYKKCSRGRGGCGITTARRFRLRQASADG